MGWNSQVETRVWWAGEIFARQNHLGVLHAIDLENLERGIQNLTHRTTDLSMAPVDGTDLFVLIRHEVSEGQVNLSNLIVRQVERIGVTDQGQNQLIRTWPSFITVRMLARRSHLRCQTAWIF